jgi:ATP-dependent Clp protease ATP-binding subunit ClpC
LGSQKINAAKYLTPTGLSILERAYDKSLITNSSFFLYLMKFLMENRGIREMIVRFDVSPKEFGQKIDDLLQETASTIKNDRKTLIVQAEDLSKKAFEISLFNYEKFIEPRSFFAALGSIDDKAIIRIFNLFSITPEDLENALVFARFQDKIRWLRRMPTVLGGFAHHPHKVRRRIMNRAWTARPTPNLDKYAVDFTDLAEKQQIGFLIGHKEEYGRVINILSRPTKPNVLLVGEPGSGKEALVAHLAFKIIKDKVPEPLFDKRLVMLSIGNLISGASSQEISARMNKMVEEIISAGNVILYIPDIHNLIKTSGEGHLSAADILAPIFNNDAFPIIGATYPREFKQMIEPQSDFANAFEIVRLNEISEDEAIKLLTYDSIILEGQYKITVSFGAIKQAVGLAHKYFRQKLLPSSAEDLLKESLADATQKGDKVLQADDVIAIAERKTNIPIHRVGKEEAEKLLNLENIIHQKLIDQEEAVKSVSRALREYRSGLSRKGGPIAVFLFVGPTGVGKTELSKILTKIQFGSENLMLRFDMSEYQDKQSIFRFIGSPDGKMAGNLTEAVIQKPYCLILLDEFEKAHQDILNLFLQVFDDGRLTDNFGRVVDFTNTIIIATSNAHSEFIKTHIEAHTPMETIAEELKKKLTDYFKPELLNRFSGVIAFKTLSKENIEAIAGLHLKDLARSLEETNGISLNFDEAVVKKIAELGYDPVFGARPLRGVISEKLRSVLAEKILREEIVKGGSVKVVLENGEIKFI